MINPSIPGYTIVEKIGEGGFGLVYKAKQTNTGQLVAIKVLKTTQEVDEQKKAHQKARFERETQLGAQISHPHIVQLLDKGYTETGEPFAVFEYISGQTLKDYIIRQGSLNAAETGELMGQVLDALASAHEQGIVHRDLKPQNLMVTQTGAKNNIKILDFGIGAFTQEYRTKDYKSLTLTKEMVGTPSYSAPEQLRGEPPTVKSDMYAWGLILIECLTGRTVMEGDSIAEIFQRQLQASNVPIPSAIVGHPLANLLRRVLDKNPQQRLGDATQLYKDYKVINFNTIVGKIAQAPPQPMVDDDATVDSDLDVVIGHSDKRQITVLCVKLSLVLPNDYQISDELLDTIQKDQLATCTDIAVRFGAHIAGNLADNLMFYFGYPVVSDNDARRAGRAALELVNQTQKRSALLQALHGISLDIRVSLHSGSVLVKQGITPEGMNPNIAFELLYQAAKNTVLVSETAKQLLDPFLEFEVAETKRFSNTTKAMKLYSLVGERQTEAMSFLRPWSANRQMIGREVEKQKFMDLWASVKSEGGKSLLLDGQAGIGKSKLTYECKKLLRNDEVTVAECRCLPEHENNALFPFFDMLRKHWGLQEGENQDFNISRLKEVLTDAQCEIKQVLPVLCSWLSIPLVTEEAMEMPAPEQQKDILMEALEKLVLNVGQAQPFLLIVEDIHWIDPTSKEFLERLLQKLSQHNYLLLMTTRPHFKPDWNDAHLTVLELKPLSQEAIKEMIEGVLEGKGVSDDTVAYIAQRADGVPLFIEELTHMLLEQNYLILEQDVYHLDENIDQDTVPVTLQDLLNARLNKLGLAKETAQLAAAIGRNFDYDLLVHSSLRDEASVQADLDKLINADLVYRQRKVSGESYIFRHALIRDAAYDGMPNALQKDTHGRIATTLENEFPQVKEENPFEVARHFAGAEHFENASSYGIQMVQKQVVSSANKEAVVLNNIVKGWTSSISIPEKQVESELKLNNAVLPAFMAVEGYGGESIEEINKRNDELIEQAQTLGITLSGSELDDMAEGSRWLQFINNHFRGSRKEARAIANELVEDIKITGNHERAVGRLPIISEAHMLDGEWETARDMCLEVLEVYNPETDIEIGIKYGLQPKSSVQYYLSRMYCGLGYPNKAREYIEASLKEANEVGHLVSLTLSHNYLAILGSMLFDKTMVTEAVNRYERDHGDKTGNDWVLPYLYMLVAWSKGDTEYAEQFVIDCIASKQDYALGYFEPYLADTYLSLEAYDKAIELMEKSVKRCVARHEIGTIPMVSRSLAECYYAVDQSPTERVVQELERAIDIAYRTKARWFEFQAIVDYSDLLLQHEDTVADDTKSKIFKRLRELMDFLVQEDGEQTTGYFKRAELLWEKIEKRGN